MVKKGIKTMKMTELIDKVKILPKIDLKDATAYHNHLTSLIKFVDDSMASDQTISELIGNNSLITMTDNHRHHAAFMATVFSINNYELLAKTVPWVYRSYHSHGFSYDYFPLELKTWMKANETILDKSTAENINKVYKWLIENHKLIINISQSSTDSDPPINENWLEIKNAFISALLQGEHKKCLAIANDTIKSASDIEPFYLYIIQPVMYEVGMRWELAEISVAHEHLASAIVGSIMAALSLAKIDSKKIKGKVVVTSSPNEFHEIGAWMVSDVLEYDGWEVQYLGANTPHPDLINLLKSYKPDILAISVTISFNINKARDIITEIKNTPDLHELKVMIGGRVFNENSELWRSTGADGFAANLHDAKELAEKWCKNEF